MQVTRLSDVAAKEQVLLGKTGQAIVHDICGQSPFGDHLPSGALPKSSIRMAISERISTGD